MEWNGIGKEFIKEMRIGNRAKNVRRKSSKGKVDTNERKSNADKKQFSCPVKVIRIFDDLFFWLLRPFYMC